LFNQLQNISRFNKQLIIAIVDFLLLPLILLISLFIRLGIWFVPHDPFTLALIFFAPILGVIIFAKFGLYRSVTRYFSFKAIWSIVQAVSLYSVIWGFIFIIGDGIPRSIVLINWVLAILLIVGSRMIARWILTKLSFNQNHTKLGLKSKNVLIYGAGDAGIQLVGALSHTNQYNLVGFIDDSGELYGIHICGLQVYSQKDILKLINKFNVNEILIAIPSVSRSRRIEIVDSLKPYQLEVRALPNFIDLAGGKVTANDLRKISIEDLLGREPVKPNQKLLSKNITDRVVMVTGAGGSIGSELCRQILLLKPKALVLFEISELALYSIEKELLNKSNVKKINIYPVLGSVVNRKRVKKILKHFKVDTIYHAAAYKHVPIVELNIHEGIETNIFGTLCCAQEAIAARVKTFVLISTDKAVRPTNVMGVTKRIAELILQAKSEKQNFTKFSMVRFGNVLNSSGSVIPLFKKQIKEGGPLTVTDKNITRYFMLISEAVELVIQAGAMGKGGDVFILDMGDPLKIVDLAKKMINLSGLQLKDKLNPRGDIEIIYVGLRPGEKLYEELLVGGDVSITENSRIMRAKEKKLPWIELQNILDALKDEMEDNDHEEIRKILLELVPEFKPEKKIKDILYN
jgi:FlaA1/EpsC-like NDP-sugar epimerase